MKIAIIGSGIAGLTIGWLAGRDGHAVTLFERQSALGMDAHSIDWDLHDRRHRIDVPPRLFNTDEWPHLSRLYRLLKVATQDVDATKSFSVGREKSWLQLGDSYRLGLAPQMLLNSQARRVGKDALRMRASVTPESIANLKHDTTLGQFLQDGKYSDDFVFDFLYPALAATVFTCSYKALDRYPAKIALSNLLNLFDQSALQRTTHGTSDVATRLADPIDCVRTETTISAVENTSDQVRVVLDDGQHESFDHLVFATQANSALAILSAPSSAGCFERELQILGDFQYENVPVVVHTDERLMPRDRKAWKCFNFISQSDRSDAQCTIWLNRFYEHLQSEPAVFQTIRPTGPPDPQQVIARAQMQRPVVTAESTLAVQQLAQLQQADTPPDRRVWFCGSYASPGVPLLESGVVSSISVATQLSISVPDELSLASIDRTVTSSK